MDVIFYGQDIKCPDAGVKFEVEDGFNKRFVKKDGHSHSYYTSLEVQMPKHMSYVTYHKTYHAKPEQNTSMSAFIF